MSGTTLPTSGQGGYLLPAGYLSTSGSQIVDANGNPVRIDSVGWNGTDDSAGGVLQGLWTVSYQTIMDAIKADGFNAIRIPWSDVNLTAMPNAIDYSRNPDLAGLNTLQVFQKVVAYAGQIGLKIIFDHHTNDGGPNGYGGQQANGLWFDSGPGTDGTDGSGTTGTVTAAKFQQDTVTLASTFKGNATVIGFDLDNEPTSGGNINWGQGGPTDIQAMYTTVGNAVEAADPGALIIAEGPQEYQAPNGGYGMSTTVNAPEGDLTGVTTKPVTLSTSNKVVYSVHEYPSTISGTPADSGSAYVQQMNQAWGFLVSQNIAPVWIGEMGGSLDGTADSSGSGLADEQAWAATLIGYMNGQDGSRGGPTFTGNQQPISGDWWLAGSEAGQWPDGIQSAWGVGNYRPGQQAITNQMVFVPKAAPVTTPVITTPVTTTPVTTTPVTNTTPVTTTPSTPSPNDTVVKAGSTAAITDASGNKWTITAGGLVAVNGAADTTTGNVAELAYVNGTIWQENTSNLWWGETQPNSAWAGTPGTVNSPLPVTANTDTLVLQVSEDAYAGDAQFTVTVNGVQVGGAYAATTSHAAGQETTLKLSGSFGLTPTVVVTFTNDLWGGPGLDRNLYVDGMTYDGLAHNGSAALYSNGSATFALAAPSPDNLALKVSEDAYAGDAQFNVMVNGAQVGGTYSATASHAAGQDTTLNLSGYFGPNPNVVVTYINDAWGGPGLDRNFYLDGITYDGLVQTASAPLYSGGSASFALAAPPQDTLMMKMSEDAYNGDSQYTVTVNGVQIGGTYSAIASHAAGQDNMLTLNGYFGAAPVVAVTFTNDAWGGPGLDRNLYVDGITYDGVAQTASAGIYSNSTATFSLPAPTPDTLTLKMSEDAYAADAQYTVSVNGVQVGGTYSTNASHSAGQDTTLSLSGHFGGAPTVVVTFLNDAWGGPGLDRNLYVDGMTYDGVTQTASAGLYSNGPAAFALHGSAKSTAVPNATMTLTDNNGTTATLNVITSGSQVAYGNGAQTNLDGTVRQTVDSTGVVNISTDMFNNGPVSLGVLDKGGASYHVSNFAASNVEVGGATAGSITVDGAAGGLIKVDSGTYAVSIAAEAVTNGSAAQNRMSVALLGSGNDSLLIDDSTTAGLATNVVTLGSGNDTMHFIGSSATNVYAGSGFDSVVATAGTNLFTAGSGTFDVTGGTGTNGYVFHTGGGFLEIEDFGVSKSNYVTIDKALQASMTQSSDGHGGTMMTLGATGHGIDFAGVSGLPTGQIRYA